jgi:hypothetical protein
MNQAGKSAHGATSRRWKSGVASVLGTWAKLAASANDVLGSTSSHAVATDDAAPGAAFRIERRPTLGEG